MTTPDERTKSILDTRDFLRLLAASDEVTVSASALPGIWADPETDARKPRHRASAALLAAPGKC